MPIRDGDEWEKGDRRVKPRDRRRPGRPWLPWTASRTLKIMLRRCPSDTDQQLQYVPRNRRFPEITVEDNLTVFSYSGSEVP